MKYPGQFRCMRIRGAAPAFGTLWLVMVLGATLPAGAESSRQPPPETTGRRFESPSARKDPIVADVALGPQGVLEGRVVGDAEGFPGAWPAQLPVVLWREGTQVAATRTDAEGKFRFWRLSGGLYRVAVDTAEGPQFQFCRAWRWPGAPPHASRRVNVLLDGGVARGQSPFPITSFPRAAAVGAMAAGVIATPIIYGSVKRDRSIPSTPTTP